MINPTQSLIGHVNDPKTRTIEPHPRRFKIVKRLLEEFARGEQSLTAFQRALTAAGIRGPHSGNPLPLSSIGNLLRNPFYYGVFMHNGEMHQGTHSPMISKSTFDDIQQALTTVGKPRHNRQAKGFAFLDFATCGTCGYLITAERHTKQSGRHFVYYRCTRKNKHIACNETYVRDEKFEADVVHNTSLVALPDEWKEKFLAKLETWEGEAAVAQRQQLERAKADLDALKTKLDRLNTAFVEGDLDVQEFKELKNPLIVQKAQGEQKMVALERRRATWLEPVLNWILEANTAGKLASERNFSEMKSFLKKVGSNRQIRSQTLSVSFKKPWDSLAKTNLVARSATKISPPNSDWWSRGDSNP